MISAPGRVNLIGEHIDYHGLPVLPMALRRSIRVHFHPRSDSKISVTSGAYGHREFAWTAGLTPVARGDWENYLRAAAQAVAGKWGVLNGIDATIEADLPPAAGLSSSSALIVAVTLALLRANHREASFEELMEMLPDGEQFVGTRGGGMDHAASLASRAGCASLIEFAPLAVRHIPIPADWAFLVAHSLHTAEKSGAVRERYNARPRRGHRRRCARLGFASYARSDRGRTEERALRPRRDEASAAAFLHVVTEAFRVRARRRGDARERRRRFGRLLLESHASLRDRLQVSCPALGPSGGCRHGLRRRRRAAHRRGFRRLRRGLLPRAPISSKVRDGLIERFYAGRPDHTSFARRTRGAGAVNS